MVIASFCHKAQVAQASGLLLMELCSRILFLFKFMWVFLLLLFLFGWFVAFFVVFTVCIYFFVRTQKKITDALNLTQGQSYPVSYFP